MVMGGLSKLQRSRMYREKRVIFCTPQVGSEEGRVGGSLTAVCLVGESTEKERDGAMIY